MAKYGIAAGATFGDRATHFPCADMASVSANSGMMTAVIGVHTAARKTNSVGDFCIGIAKTRSGETAAPFEAPDA